MSVNGGSKRQAAVRLARLRSAVPVMLAVLVALLGSASQVAAQAGPSQPADGSEAAAASRVVLRFLTTSDYPPFSFYDEDGVLTGFNVDLARALCLELSVACDIKVQEWSELVPALARREGDAILASQLITPQALQQIDFTDRYFHTPGRFAGRREAKGLQATPEGLDGKRIAVAVNTTHEAFVKQFFRGSRILVFDDADIAREAAKSGEVDVVFDDGIGLAFWLNGTASAQCCEFKGGPFLEPRYFGDGVGIGVAKGDIALKADLDAALRQVRANGRYSELVTRYFPFRVY